MVEIIGFIVCLYMARVFFQSAMRRLNNMLEPADKNDSKES